MEPKREVWSFFSGAMGLDLGFEQAGLAPSLCVELDHVCAQTARLNRPLLDFMEADVSRISGGSLRQRRDFGGEVFATIGGPPCQSFSPGGKRAALADARGNLIYEYLRLIDEIRPRYFVLENVANLATAALRHRPIAERPGKHWSLKRYDKDGKGNVDDAAPLDMDERGSSALRQILDDFHELGYGVAFGVLDAADFGAAQHRLRFVMLGSRDGAPPALPRPHLGAEAGLPPFRTVRDVIERLRDDPGPHSNYTESVRNLFAQVPEGGNWRSLPSALQREAMGGAFESGGGKTGFYRRLGWDNPSPTITGRANRKGSALCHPEFDRPLSVRECAALQGFPPEWRFSGSMNAQYTQIGNAVPVPLGRAIAEALIEEDARTTDGGLADSSEEMLYASLDRLRRAARNKKSGPRQPSLLDAA